jgi:hypothetical protein
MAGLLPDSVRLRPGKARFESLVVDSLAGPDRAAVEALLGDRAAELGAYVDLGRVRDELLNSPPAGGLSRFRWMWQVWRLTTAECWLRSQGRPLADLLPPDASPSPPVVAIHCRESSYVFPP